MSNHVSAVARCMHLNNVILCRRPLCATSHPFHLPVRHLAAVRSFSLTTPRWDSSPLHTQESTDEASHHFPAQSPKANDVAHQSVGEKSAISTPFHPTFNVQLNKLPLSTDFVSHPGISDAFRTEFVEIFAAIFRDHCYGHDLEKLRRSHARRVRRADTLWKTCSNDVLASWLSTELDDADRAHSLVDLLAGSVLTSPTRLLDVLSGLGELDRDFEVRISCLYLSGFLYKSDLLQDPTLMRRFDSEIDRLRPSSKWPPSAIAFDHLRLLLWRSNDEQVRALLVALRSKYSLFGKKTLLLLTSFCANAQMPDEAFAFLQLLPTPALQTPDLETMKTCMQLLKHDTVVQTDTGANFRYLSYLLERGLKPDDLLYSRIVNKAMESGYPGVAWDLYHYTQTLNVTLQPRTYLTLLRHAFRNQNLAAVDEVLAQVQQHESLYADRHLLLYAMNMVRRLNYAQREMSAGEGITHVLALYDRVYSRKSLANFGFVPADSAVDIHVDHPIEKAVPDVYALSFTVWAYVLCHKKARTINHLWHHISHVVEAGNQTVRDCLNVDLLYNAFIWLNMRDAANIPEALTVFQYMIEKEYCIPTARTWSILICGFLYQKQEKQAQQVYDLMIRHGFKLQHICQEYIPQGATLADLQHRMHAVLDQQNMLDGLIGDQESEEAHRAATQTEKAASRDDEFYAAATAAPTPAGVVHTVHRKPKHLHTAE